MRDEAERTRRMMMMRRRRGGGHQPAAASASGCGSTGIRATNTHAPFLHDQFGQEGRQPEGPPAGPQTFKTADINTLRDPVRIGNSMNHHRLQGWEKLDNSPWVSGRAPGAGPSCRQAVRSSKSVLVSLG
ncbi:hypothetical protein AMECASPLE_002349 [Ameca splendens]|uniref:Uncharacterized protein n=1 Tax=Ameca splendens TaxID=208324 RepID=A0ABV0YKM9_9TELE